MRLRRTDLLASLALAAALASPAIGQACSCSAYCSQGFNSCSIDCPSCMACTCNNYGSYVQCCYQDKDGQWHCSDVEC